MQWGVRPQWPAADVSKLALSSITTILIIIIILTIIIINNRYDNDCNNDQLRSTIMAVTQIRKVISLGQLLLWACSTPQTIQRAFWWKNLLHIKVCFTADEVVRLWYWPLSGNIAPYHKSPLFFPDFIFCVFRKAGQEQCWEFVVKYLFRSFDQKRWLVWKNEEARSLSNFKLEFPLYTLHFTMPPSVFPSMLSLVSKSPVLALGSFS